MTTKTALAEATLNVFKHQFDEYDGGLTFDEVAQRIESVFLLGRGEFDESGIIESLLAEGKIEMYRQDEEGNDTDDPTGELLYRLAVDSEDAEVYRQHG